MSLFLKDLYERSINEYLKYNSTNSQSEKTKDIKNIYKFINYLEDYIVGLNDLGFITVSNAKDVIKEIQKIQTISVLPKNQRGIYGLTTSDYRIKINPNLVPSKHLSGEERTLLYIGHEVGHIIHKMWTKDIETYAKNTLLSNRRNKRKI